MKVLSISTDRKIFAEGSSVFSRTKLYASKVSEMHIVVFTLQKEKHTYKQIGNLHIYPTNSLTQWLYVASALRLGKKIIKEHSLVKGESVISTQDPFQTGFVGARLSGKFSLPLQVQIHTDFLSRYYSRSFFNNIRNIIAHYVIPKAKGIRVVSETISNSLIREFPHLKTVPSLLPVFVDIEKIISEAPKRDIKKDFPKFKFIIFMASRLTKEKRINIALRTMKKVVEKFPHAGLIIAGAGTEKLNLQRQVSTLGLEKNVVFLGWQDDLISYYKTANIFMLTSEYEGYGMTLIEAGASGCPIVTTRVGMAKTGLFVNKENSFVCPVDDVECLSGSVLEVINSNSVRELFKHKMQDSIKRRSISKEEYATQYIALLQKLLPYD